MPSGRSTPGDGTTGNGDVAREQAASRGLSYVPASGSASGRGAAPAERRAPTGGSADVDPTRRGLLSAFCAAPLALGLREDPAEDAATPPELTTRTVILVRHAEKGKDDERDPGLSEPGRERAAALASLLAGADVDVVLSTDYRRTRDTAGPIAADAGLDVELYDPRSLDALVARLGELAGGSVALVVGHSNTTPQALTALGAPEPGGLVDSRFGRILPEDCYDRVYVATLVQVGADGPLRCAGSLELRYGR